MKANIYETIKRNSTKGKTLFFLCTQGLFQVLFAVIITPTFMIYSNGIKPLDVHLGYGVLEVNKFLLESPPEALNFYLHYFFPLDLVFPLLYSISFSLIISFLFMRAFKKESILQKFTILPFVAAACDYFENFSFVYMISNTPALFPKLATVTSFLSLVKWSLAYIGIIAIITSSLILLYKKIFGKVN